MKPVYVTLVALSTGIFGFITGGGLGLLGGSFGGNIVGSIAGSCIVLDTATEMGTLTPEQAQKIGKAVGAKIGAEGNKVPSSPTEFEINSIKGTTDSCNQFIQGIVAATK